MVEVEIFRALIHKTEKHDIIQENGNGIDLAIDFAERLSPHIAIERFVSQSPAELLIAPNWGIKNYEFTARLLKRMKERDTWQGKLFTEV